MELFHRVESMIFEKTLQYPSIQVLKNKEVIIQAQCYVKEFTDTRCVIHTPHGHYQIKGQNLSLNEYADFVLKIQSDGISQIEIVGDLLEK